MRLSRQVPLSPNGDLQTTLMLRLVKPSEKRIRRFLDHQQTLPLSYREVGATRYGRRGAPHSYPVNYYRVQLGAGETTYRRAVDALHSWKIYATLDAHLPGGCAG